MFLGYIEIIMRLQHDADDVDCPDNDEIGEATPRSPSIPSVVRIVTPGCIGMKINWILKMLV